MIRQQLPAHSPLHPRKLLGAAIGAAVHPAKGVGDLSRLLAERYAAPEVLLTSSGTHALQAALTLAWSTEPWAGRPVALPAYTCYDVATAAVGAAVRVTFYDIDPESLCPDSSSLRRALAEGAGVVVANSLYGFPLDWTWLRQECEAAGALLVEDAAQALGSAWEGREGGSFGDLTVLSFGRGKGWTGGGGGALLLRGRFLDRSGGDAASVVEPSKSTLTTNVRALGLSLAQWAFGRPALFWIPSSIPPLALGKTRYKEPSTPMKIGALAAAAACAHVDLARAECSGRRAVAARWLQVIEERPIPTGAYQVPAPLEGGSCGYLRLPVIAGACVGDADLLALKGKRLGFARGYPKSLPQLDALHASTVSGNAPHLPGALEIARRLLTLPAHSRTTERDVREGGDLLTRAALSERIGRFSG